MAAGILGDRRALEITKSRWRRAIELQRSNEEIVTSTRGALFSDWRRYALVAAGQPPITRFMR